MKTVLKMAGVVLGTVAVLTLFVSTVAMAGAGESTNPDPGTCINAECPYGCQGSGDCPDCLCGGDQILTQDCGESCPAPAQACDGYQIRTRFCPGNGDQMQKQLQHRTCGDIDGSNQFCAGECTGEQLQNQACLYDCECDGLMNQCQAGTCEQIGTQNKYTNMCKMGNQ